jgi:cell division protein FtsA
MAEKIITAIDLGSSKITTVIATLHQNNKLEIKGIGVVQSESVEAGIVKDIKKTSDALLQSIEMAEREAHHSAENLFLAISGTHIHCRNTTGKISIANGNQPCEIDDTHIETVINDAKNSIKIKSGSAGLEILHCIPEVFDVDDQKSIVNPLGMSGFSLELHALLLLAESSQLKNIRKSFEMANLPPPTIVVGALATAEAVASEDERNLGCIVCDIGGDTSDMLVFHKGKIKAYMCKPTAGKAITDDIAVGLRTSPTCAENIKIEHGNAVASSVDPDITIDVEGIGGRSPQPKSLAFIAEIIQSRSKDIFDECYKSIFQKYANLEGLTGGVLLTGGTARVKNIQYVVEDESVFNLHCRIAYPEVKRLSGAISNLENPAYACIVGLLYFIVKNAEVEESKGIDMKHLKGGVVRFFKNIYKKITEL